MDTTEHEAFVKDYETKVEEMDSSTDHLESDQRMEYEKDRDNFKTHLSKWKDNLEDTWDDFKSETEQSWNNLKEKFHRHG